MIQWSDTVTYSGKTIAAGAASIATSIPTTIAAAVTESWSAVAAGAAIGVMLGAYFVVSAFSDKRSAWQQSQINSLVQDLAKATTDLREANHERNALRLEMDLIQQRLASVDRKVDVTRCPLRATDGGVPCGATTKTDIAPGRAETNQ